MSWINFFFDEERDVGAGTIKSNSTAMAGLFGLGIFVQHLTRARNPLDNIYIAAGTASVDLSFGASTLNLVPSGSAGLLLLKLDSAGTPLWGRDAIIYAGQTSGTALIGPRIITPAINAKTLAALTGANMYGTIDLGDGKPRSGADIGLPVDGDYEFLVEYGP